MKICVIPARGGSKRIPRKNIRDFAASQWSRGQLAMHLNLIIR